MTSQIFEYYLKYAFATKPAEEIFVRHPDNNKVAIIIEPRFDETTELVIYNFMHFLNPLGFNLLIISYSGYRKMIEDKHPYAFVLDIDDGHIVMDASGVPNISINSYNMIMMDPFLWENIQEETAVIFQRDCIMFRDFSEHFLMYDYAGSNYLSNLAPLFGGINGGFSIRKPATMLECLRRITWEDIDEYRKTRKYFAESEEPILNRNEDVFFTHSCELLCKVVPDSYSRTFLCIENGFNPSTAVHHGWNKNYMEFEHIMYLLKSSPLFSRVPEPNIQFLFI